MYSSGGYIQDESCFRPYNMHLAVPISGPSIWQYVFPFMQRWAGIMHGSRFFLLFFLRQIVRLKYAFLFV